MTCQVNELLNYYASKKCRKSRVCSSSCVVIKLPRVRITVMGCDPI